MWKTVTSKTQRQREAARARHAKIEELLKRQEAIDFCQVLNTELDGDYKITTSTSSCIYCRGKSKHSSSNFYMLCSGEKYICGDCARCELIAERLGGEFRANTDPSSLSCSNCHIKKYTMVTDYSTSYKESIEDVFDWGDEDIQELLYCEFYNSYCADCASEMYESMPSTKSACKT